MDSNVSIKPWRSRKIAFPQPPPVAVGRARCGGKDHNLTAVPESSSLALPGIGGSDCTASGGNTAAIHDRALSTLSGWHSAAHGS